MVFNIVHTVTLDILHVYVSDRLTLGGVQNWEMLDFTDSPILYADWLIKCVLVTDWLIQITCYPGWIIETMTCHVNSLAVDIIAQYCKRQVSRGLNF